MNILKRRRLLPLALLLLPVLLPSFLLVPSSATAASAPAPAWTIRADAKPTNLSPSSALNKIVVLVADDGGAYTDGTPVTVTDTLPAGLTVAHAHMYEQGLHGEEQGGACAETTSTVTCTYGSAVGDLNTDELFLEVQVAVDPGASGALSNTASVSGGGAATVSSTDLVTVSPQDPSFGFTGPFLAGYLDADGAPDATAGDHPSAVATTFVARSAPGEGVDGGSLPAVGGLKDVVVDLPAGFIGDSQAAPTCPQHLLYIEFGWNCPKASIIGTVDLDAAPGGWTISEPGATPISDVSLLYNVAPEHGYAAQFSFDYLSHEGSLYAKLVHTSSGYVVRIISATIPPVVGLVGIRATFFGDPAVQDGGATAPVAFFTNPSDCSSAGQVTTIHMDSWENPAPVPLNTDGSENFNSVSFEEPQWQSATSESPSVTGCEHLIFQPTLSFTPDTTQADTPTGATVDLQIPQNTDPTGLATPPLKNVTVALPRGMSISPSSANGLQACSDQEFAQDSIEPATCPEASVVGSVRVHTPLLKEELEGRVFVGAPECDPCTDTDAQSGRLVRLFVEVADAARGIDVKLPGTVSLDPSTGQLTASFREVPQLPFDNLEFKFKSGERAPLSTPGCGSYTSNVDLTPWSAPYTPDAILAPAFQINERCAPRGFAPAFSAGTTNSQAGAYSPFTLTFSRSDGEQDFSDVEQTLPPGLLAKLAGVPRCGEAEARAGACPAGSRIGSVTVGAGPGSDPYYTTGSIYLTGPYNGGPFGEVVVVQAVAGPFNLGTVVVHGSIRVNPTTAQATVVSDPFPSILDGIPLQIRTVNVTLDRPEFTFNPTSCAQSAVTGKLVSTQGATAAVSSPFTAANCAGLAFKPAVSVGTQGRASKAGGASLTLKVVPVAGQADTAKFDFQLPKQLPARLTTLQKACTEAQFNSNPAGCPAASDIGTAKALTPLLSAPAEGPIYLVSHGGAAFPDAEVILQSEGVTVVLDGKTQIKKGVTYSHFETVPDVPFTSFEAILPEGKYSIFGANLPASTRYDFCGQKLSMPMTMVGQNGAVVKQSTKVGVTGCPKLKKAKAARKRPTKASKSNRRGK